MKSKTKLVIFSSLIISMLFYIGMVFYLSEPKYIDNCYKQLECYDYVSIPEYVHAYETKQQVINGIVLQVDKTKAIVRCKKWSEEFYELDLKTSEYRIIGRGTIYHKVNDYVGFNIMVVSQFLIGILLAVLIIVVSKLLTDILN